MTNQPKITALATRVLWACNGCDETYLMHPPLRSHKQCPNCKRSMRIEHVVEHPAI